MRTYSIREISELFSLPASTLRYYESEGLLPCVEKSSSGQRIYTEEHIERLNCINCFKRTGMTIPQLRKFFEYETDEAQHIDDIIHLLEDQEKQVDEKLRQLQKDSAHVHHKVAHYKAIKHALENNLALPVWEEL
ncbi:MerR family transcriptional regulator [Blautia sp. MSJ-19]|uniref:MerR family transcriptional regulator n=1 Tax=Blautia sp. MSJ-19 TaxID=2841517 RepID=UPI001C0F24BD|nr:MerR family transcriptional regulator [Blautia sp. MSJ-19]MBU5482031.1 MerR family transcriptional regulator [Blautia sp. MSJ-19]